MKDKIFEYLKLFKDYIYMALIVILTIVLLNEFFGPGCKPDVDTIADPEANRPEVNYDSDIDFLECMARLVDNYKTCIPVEEIDKCY